jgi:hypothetical protein
MFHYNIKAGTTDVSVVIRIIDSTDGTPETGVVWNTAGIDLQYRRELEVSTAITEATLAALTTAHSDGGFLHIGNGYYRLDLPDAACATGKVGVLVHGIVTGMVVIGCYIQLVTYDPFDSVRLGLTALPNAAADAAGGLPISDAGGLDMDAMKTQVNDVHTDVGTVTTDVAAVHTHVGTIDGHITADYTSTEKTCIDLLDDAAGGLADIHTDLGTAITNIGDVHATDLPALKTVVDDIHNTDLPAVKTDTAAILVDTGTTLDGRIPTALVGGKMDANVGSKTVGLALTAQEKLDVNAEVDTALTDIHLDHLLAVDYDPAAKPGTATALLNEIVESDAGVSRFTANALEQAPSGTGASAEVIADAVWDELVTGHDGAGKAGTQLWTDIDDIHTDLGTAITAIGDVHATDLPDLHSDVAAVKTELDDIHNTDLPAVKADTADIHTDVGTAITAIGDVHATDLPAAKAVLDNIHDTDLPAVKTDTAAILLDTGTDGVILKAAGLNADAVDKILDEVVEGTLTFRQMLTLFEAALAGKSTGGGTASVAFRDKADAKNRIAATVDANGNRTAVTLDVS